MPRLGRRFTWRRPTFEGCNPAGSSWVWNNSLQECVWLSDSAANFCHLDRPRATLSLSKGTECERRDPENACTTLIRGVSTRTLSLTPYRAGKVQHLQFGENASYRHGRGRTVGISRLRPQSLSLPRSPLEM